MIKKTRNVENKKRISKRFESQRPVRNIEEVLADMDETARGIIRYGVENAEIADLMDEAEQNLDADYWKADKEGDEETKKAIEDEMERMENEATECCGKIIDAIDSVWPVSELTPAQKQRLGWELEDLRAYDTHAMEDPSTFVKLIVAEYALSEDNGLLEALEFACQNALDETEEIDMDESVQRRRRNLRRVIESRRARAKKYNEVMYYDKEGNYLFGKAEMQKRAEELAHALFSKNIDVKDLYVFTIDGGTESYIDIKENTPSKYKFRSEIGIISLKHKDNEVTVSGSDHVDRIKLGDDLNTSDTVEIADIIKQSPEFDLIIKEYNDSRPNKKESKRRVSKCRKFENALYNDLELVEDSYVLMQDTDRYDDEYFFDRAEAVEAMEEAQNDGEEDMWVGRVERIDGRLEIMFVEGESA